MLKKELTDRQAVTLVLVAAALAGGQMYGRLVADCKDIAREILKPDPEDLQS